MVTASADGALRVWDLRYNGPPVASVAPDGSPIVAMSQSPFGSFCAVATAKGLYSVDVGDRCGHTECIAPAGTFKVGGAPQRLAWNTTTNELYVSLESGSVSVYSHK
jgi:WD40 repeat protein